MSKVINNKIYVVSREDWDYGDTVGYFTTEQEAVTYCSLMNQANGEGSTSYYDYQEIELLNLAKEKRKLTKLYTIITNGRVIGSVSDTITTKKEAEGKEDFYLEVYKNYNSEGEDMLIFNFVLACESKKEAIDRVGDMLDKVNALHTQCGDWVKAMDELGGHATILNCTGGYTS